MGILVCMAKIKVSQAMRAELLQQWNFYDMHNDSMAIEYQKLIDQIEAD